MDWLEVLSFTVSKWEVVYLNYFRPVVFSLLEKKKCILKELRNDILSHFFDGLNYTIQCWET